MSRYAKIEDGIVTYVIECDDSYAENHFGSYIKSTEETGFADVGDSYDPHNKKFIDPKPFDSWTLNENFVWVAPKPNPGFGHYWSEEDLNWVAVEGYDPNLAAE